MLAQKKKKSRKSKSEAVGESRQKKKSKEAKKKGVVDLGTYSERSGRGTSLKPSSEKLASEHIDTMQSSGLQISSPTPNSKSTKIQIQVSSSTSHTTESTQTQTSFVTHSGSNSETSSDSSSQDPSSPSTENLSKLTNPPSNTISEEGTYSDPDDFETIGNLVKSLAQQQRTKTIPPIIVTASEQMPISSTPPTRRIPVMYLDISDDEILISDTIPTITSPADPSPQKELVPFQFIPNNIEECINLFGFDALKRIHEIRTSTFPHPVLVKRAWEEFRRWLDTSFQNIAQMAESTKQAEVLAAAERRIQYELEISTRLATRKRAAEEKAALEAAEKVEFLRDQAEAEKAEALMLVEKA